VVVVDHRVMWSSMTAPASVDITPIKQPARGHRLDPMAGVRLSTPAASTSYSEVVSRG